LRTGIPSGDRLQKAVLLLVVAIMMAGCATCSEQLEKLGDWGRGLYAKSEEGPSATQGPEESKQTDFYVHTVRWPGESLSIISKWYTGNIDQWSAVAKANPALNPNLIRVGVKIRIPKKIMTNVKPMPKEFVASFYREDTKGSGKAKPATPPKDGEPMLIGPKSYSDQ
jgi:LysM repeat protein